MLRPKYTHDGNFVTPVELGTPQAIFPGLERQGAALHLQETHLAEKIGNVSKGEYGVERIFVGFFEERFD
jgi:hypothetical protein